MQQFHIDGGTGGDCGGISSEYDGRKILADDRKFLGQDPVRTTGRHPVWDGTGCRQLQVEASGRDMAAFYDIDQGYSGGFFYRAFINLVGSAFSVRLYLFPGSFASHLCEYAGRLEKYGWATDGDGAGVSDAIVEPDFLYLQTGAAAVSGKWAEDCNWNGLEVRGGCGSNRYAGLFYRRTAVSF